MITHYSPSEIQYLKLLLVHTEHPKPDSQRIQCYAMLHFIWKSRSWSLVEDYSKYPGYFKTQCKVSAVWWCWGPCCLLAVGPLCFIQAKVNTAAQPGGFRACHASIQRQVSWRNRKGLFPQYSKFLRRKCQKYHRSWIKDMYRLRQKRNSRAESSRKI